MNRYHDLVKLLKKVKSLLKKNPFDETKNIILLESNPELSGNTYELYLYLIQNKINLDYKLYWLVDDVNKYKKFPVKNIHFLPFEPKSKKEWKQKNKVVHSAKVIISENRNIKKTNPHTYSLHLHHGTVLKDVSGIYNFGVNYNHILCPNESLIGLYKRLFKVNEEQIFISGYPRNDLLFKNDQTILKRLDFHHFNKTILWMPTFRQHKNKVRTDVVNNLPLGIPIFSNISEMENFNEHLKQLNYLLILKLHPAQDKSFINATSFSNIKILEDDDLIKNGVKLYEFIGVTDALITDYSSVYYDYLLINKPIGLTIDDLDTYKLGFVYKNIDEYLVGDRLTTISDLLSFINDLKDNKDLTLNERIKLNEKMNIKSDYLTYSEDIYEKLLKKVLAEKIT